MGYLNTVLGPVHCEELGVAAVNEHLMWGPPGWDYDAGAWFEIGKVFEKCYHEVIDYRLHGGRTYVECSAITPGRNLDIFVKIAQTSQVNIVASTGFAAEAYVSPYFKSKDADYFEELFAHEIAEGMGHTRIKAGIIKVGASGDKFTKLEEMILRAAARAAKKTGAPLITECGRFAMKHLDILKEEKLDPARIIIGHLDSKDNMDIERDKKIARGGAYLAYDQVGMEDVWCGTSGAMPDDRRVELVQAMLKAGFKDRLLLSASSNSWTLGHGEQLLHNSANMLRYFVPKLKKAGVSEEAINGILVDNPKRVLPIQ